MRLPALDRVFAITTQLRITLLPFSSGLADTAAVGVGVVFLAIYFLISKNWIASHFSRSTGRARAPSQGDECLQQ